MQRVLRAQAATVSRMCRQAACATSSHHVAAAAYPTVSPLAAAAAATAPSLTHAHTHTHRHMSTKPTKGAIGDRRRHPAAEAAALDEAPEPVDLPAGPAAASAAAAGAAEERVDAHTHTDADALGGDAAADVAPSHPYRSQIEYDAEFAVDVRNPLEHTFAHAGKYFPLVAGDADKKLFPEGFAGDMPQEFATTGSSSMLVRPTGVTLVQHLERWRQTRGRDLAAKGARVLDVDASKAYTPPEMALPRVRGAIVADDIEKELASSDDERVSTEAGPSTTDFSEVAFHPFRLLTGPSGIGKSAMLNYIVSYARRNGWITVSIPDSFHIMHKGLVLVPSRRRPGMIDQHDIAAKMLKNLFDSQAELFGKIPQRGKYAVFRYLPREKDVVVSAEREKLRRAEEEEKGRLKAQAEAKGTTWDASTYVSKHDSEDDVNIDRSSFTLRDMIEWGLAHPIAATDTLLDLLSELRQVTEFPVLMAVDGLNLMYEHSPYPQGGRTLAAEELSIPSAFQCLDVNGFKPGFGMKRGVFIGTITQRHGQRMRMFEVTNVRERFRVRIPELTRQEIHSQLLHYHNTQRFLMVMERSQVDPFAVEYYKTLCSGVPAEIYRAAMYHDATRQPYETNKAKRNRMRHAGLS